MKSVFFVIFFVFIFSCGGGEDFSKTPIDDFVRDFYQLESYSIILHDMNVEGNFAKTYMHQYRIVKVEDNVPSQEITQWFEVPKSFFDKNVDYMGMELVSKDSAGNINKVPAPPGYSNYVGNSKYGQWVSSGGHSFWSFFGQYAMMSAMFNLATYPIRRDYYSDYRSSYYSNNKPYFGRSSTGGKRWGTNSEYMSKSGSSSKWAQASRRTNAFSNKNAFTGNNSQKSTRSGSRYSSVFSSRSRSGGFGK